MAQLWPFHHRAKTTETAGPTSASDTAPVVEPAVVRQQIKVPKIRTSNVELTLAAGLLNVEPEGTYPGVDFRGTYHFKENFFAEATVGVSKLRATTYVDAAGKTEAFTSSQRRIVDYALDLGYDVLPGEAFFGRNKALNQAVYVVGGVGAIHYGGISFFAPNAGIGYRLLLNDRVAFHIDVKDYVTDKNLLGAKHLANNLESTLGLAMYF
jgi:outer membrane beta-barrel protein